MTQAVVGALNKQKFQGGDVDMCVICTEQFGDDDEIVPLPCNPSHIFHERCIATWMETKTQCPNCRAEVTKDALEA